MAAPNPYAGTSEDFDPTLHWGNFEAPNPRTYTGEKVESFDPSGEGFYSQEAGEESMVGVIDSARLRGFLRYCLGYNNMLTTAPYYLQRTNPICHPRMTGMVCTGVAHRPFSPIRPTPPVGSTNSGLKLPVNQDGQYGAVAVTEAGAGSTAHTFGFYAGYEKELVTIRFSPAPYRFLADDPGTIKEHQRNTIIDTEPRTELITLTGFKIIYAEGTGNVAPTTNPASPPDAKQRAAPTDIGQVLVKPDVVVKWFRVPEKFISNNTVPGQLYPAKILRCLGKLNRYTWLDYPKGTLLLAGARFIRKPWALAAGGDSTTPFYSNLRESIFNYDVEFLMTFFNPTKGYTSGVQIANADTYGHNCFPWRGDTPGTVLAGTDLNQGKWFYATYSGNLTNIGTDTGDRGQFEYANYDNLFDSVRNADIP